MIKIHVRDIEKIANCCPSDSNGYVTDGRPNPDRTWTECFAQLVGTVLSLWDAAELDAAGEDGEVLPKFINLTDASIKMVNYRPGSEKFAVAHWW